MDKKTYYVSPLTWMISIPFILFTVFFVVFAIAVIPSILSLANPFFMALLFFVLIFSLFFVGFPSLIFLDIPTMRLELSEEGLVYYDNVYRIYTPWENILGYTWLGSSRSFPDIIQLKEPAVIGKFSFEEGIANRRAVTEKRRWWMPMRQLKAEDRFNHYIRLPVIFFRRKDKQEGSIDQYLQYYLAHLMENQ